MIVVPIKTYHGHAILLNRVSTPVIDAAWSDPVSAPSLVQAIGVMRVESQYTEKLAAYTQAKGGK